jgi:hypothetical protein
MRLMKRGMSYPVFLTSGWGLYTALLLQQTGTALNLKKYSF